MLTLREGKIEREKSREKEKGDGGGRREGRLMRMRKNARERHI